MGGDCGDATNLIPDVDDFRHREFARLPAADRPDLDELIGIPERERTDQEGVDVTEDRRRRPDRESERDDDGRCEPGPAPDLSESETEIAKPGLDLSTSVGPDCVRSTCVFALGFRRTVESQL
jgi:hypothetical protein